MTNGGCSKHNQSKNLLSAHVKTEERAWRVAPFFLNGGF